MPLSISCRLPWTFSCQQTIQGDSPAYLAAFALFFSEKSSRGRGGQAAMRSGASLLSFSGSFYTGHESNQSVQLKPPIPRRCLCQPRKILHFNPRCQQAATRLYLQSKECQVLFLNRQSPVNIKPAARIICPPILITTASIIVLLSASIIVLLYSYIS